MVQQNQALENQIMHMHSKDADIKSMHDELTTLEEVRYVMPLFGKSYSFYVEIVFVKYFL